MTAKSNEGGAEPRTPRVFIVEVSFSVPVVAESAEEAERLADDEYANDEWREGGGSINADVAAWELKKPAGWESCIPWGGDGETTIGVLLAEPARNTSDRPPANEIADQVRRDNGED